MKLRKAFNKPGGLIRNSNKLVTDKPPKVNIVIFMKHNTNKRFTHTDTKFRICKQFTDFVPIFEDISADKICPRKLR